MAKHSFSYPAIPASAPTSPAVIRKSERNPPATPQRTNQRASVRHAQSPYTPITSLSTPYTPLSLRSVSSSNGSTLVTPASAARRLSLSLTPDVSFQGKSSKKSLADIAENWRTRANENGIRVTSGESHFADDEDDEQGELDSMSFFASDKPLLPAPYLSTSTQRRARALSQAPIGPLSQIPNPTQLSTPGRVPLGQSFSLSSGFLNTPPPKPDVLNKYRLRGTVTDPAQTRRRPPFGQQASDLCDIDEDEFAPYPPAFSPPTPGCIQSRTLPLHLSDSFNFSNISGLSDEFSYYDAVSHFDHVPPPPPEPVLSCSVCGLSNGALALLNPCSHPLCSACLTSALNIVGEKDMECAVCNVKVDDFKLQNYKGPSSGTSNPAPPPMEMPHGAYNDFTFASGILEGSFEDFVDRAQGASTPVAGARTDTKSTKPDEHVVLRIDNVPWDITPPAIIVWLKHPVERVHVLLDRKGKTLSHAFVEMANQEAAKAALRSSQNSVLGRGKRARGVTVTRSNQEELMRALFPSWQGNFDGARPSLAGLSNEHVISTLQQGLISDGELKSLLHLIRSPDSHFLKVPSLPFHSLMSILSKFPTDDDSRVFWSGSLRDTLYDVTFAAVQVLLAHVEENPFSDWTGLLAQLVRAAMDCHAFTSEQMSKLSDILEAALPQSNSNSSPASTRTASRTPDSARSTIEPFRPSSRTNIPMMRNASPYGNLAKEFGVEPHLVEALAQRLSKLT
ncbi:hypothetical protein EUX98_g1634 [Antrodiella citrinella]|uniref:RING-type domain-containing protein n=1 Tax=Antrodiella citrinella TaxID=2447956 RepID=A0A4S4N9C6_9APHY|nr:hypothetical protein EUX98_g1634 [Antrodiella citrinella]